MSMSQRPPVQYPHYPVTGVCIVSDPQKCPPGYDIVCIVLWLCFYIGRLALHASSHFEFYNAYFSLAACYIDC